MLLAILVAMAMVQPGVVSAEGPVDGTYTMTVTVPKDCDLSDGTGGVVHIDAGVVIPLGEVKVVQSGSSVSFTIAGDAYRGSISPDLNFDLTVPPLDNWIGHFALLSDGGATISGETVAACSGVTRPYGRLTGSRTSGGPAAPSPDGFPDDAPGLAFDTITNLCVRDIPGNATNCDAANEYASEFRSAMLADALALPASVSPEALLALDRLIELVGVVARASALQRPGPCRKPVPALPITNALLPVFAKLFIQGIRQAATQQPAVVEATASLADSLLLAAITADKASATGSSCSVGEG